MNIQARIKAFFTLGANFLTDQNEAYKIAKSEAHIQNPWFLPEFIDKASNQIVTQFLQKEALHNWTHLYPKIATENTGKKVGIVMAGNIPMVGFHDLLSVLITGHTAIVKLSSKDAILMQFIIDALQQIDPAFETLIYVQTQLKNCNAYLATGSNNAGNYFDQYFGKYPNIIRRNKTSIALLEGNETKEMLSFLADDMMLYFGMGCRNVTQIWVPENYDFIPLLEALGKYRYFLEHHKYKNNYDYQLALLMMNGQFYMDAGGILLSENPSPFAPIAQIHYQFYPPKQLPIFATDAIQCVVGKQHLPFGSLQQPSLLQYADGIDTLAFLTEFLT